MLHWLVGLDRLVFCCRSRFFCLLCIRLMGSFVVLSVHWFFITSFADWLVRCCQARPLVGSFSPQAFVGWLVIPSLVHRLVLRCLVRPFVDCFVPPAGIGWFAAVPCAHWLIR